MTAEISSSCVWKRCPHNSILSREKRRWLLGAKSSENGACSNSSQQKSSSRVWINCTLLGQTLSWIKMTFWLSSSCLLCQLYIFAECIWRDSRTRVIWDEAVRVWLSTLLPWALNPPRNADWKKNTMKSQRWQLAETRDPLTWTPRTTKKRELIRQNSSARGYTRASKARWVLPSTFSLSPCLRFSRRECTAGITPYYISQTHFMYPLNSVLTKSHLSDVHETL